MSSESPSLEPTAELPPAGVPGTRNRVRCSVISVADGLTLEEDTCGHDADVRLQTAGYHVVERTVVPLSPGPLGLVVRHWITADVEVLVIVADTWSADASATFDVVHRFLDRELPAFGQLFASLSFGEVGARAVVYRAMAGLANGRLLLLLPSAAWAVHLAMDKLVTPLLEELLGEIGAFPRRET